MIKKSKYKILLRLQASLSLIESGVWYAILPGWIGCKVGLALAGLTLNLIQIYFKTQILLFVNEKMHNYKVDLIF